MLNKIITLARLFAMFRKFDLIVDCVICLRKLSEGKYAGNNRLEHMNIRAPQTNLEGVTYTSTVIYNHIPSMAILFHRKCVLT